RRGDQRVVAGRRIEWAGQQCLARLWQGDGRHRVRIAKSQVRRIEALIGKRIGDVSRRPGTSSDESVRRSHVARFRVKRLDRLGIVGGDARVWTSGRSANEKVAWMVGAIATE